MKKINYLLLIMLLFFALGCRNDYLAEQNTNIEEIKFGLVSKTLSLKESLHKEKLFPQLERARNKLNNDTSGKSTDIGEITIDTDHVIYMENGPNFHNYTFKITRTHQEEGSPLENLVLVPTTEGNYREFLLTYHITEEEKQMLSQGNYQVPKEKIAVAEINLEGSFLGEMGGCITYLSSYYTTCSEGVHHNGETTCVAPIKSQLITTFYTSCTEGSDRGGGGGYPGDGDPNGGGTGAGTDIWIARNRRFRRDPWSQPETREQESVLGFLPIPILVGLEMIHRAKLQEYQ